MKVTVTVTGTLEEMRDERLAEVVRLLGALSEPGTPDQAQQSTPPRPNGSGDEVDQGRGTNPDHRHIGGVIEYWCRRWRRRGKCYEEIAEDLGITSQTLKNYRQNVMAVRHEMLEKMAAYFECASVTELLKVDL